MESGPRLEVWALEGGFVPRVEVWVRGRTSGSVNGCLDYCGGLDPIKDYILGLRSGLLDGLLGPTMNVLAPEGGLGPEGKSVQN